MNPLAFSFSIINAICGRLFNFHVRHHRLGNAPVLDDALRRLQAHNIEIGSLIDVGASDGFWSKAFAYHFPGRRHLLIDANEIHRPKLIEICQRHTNWRFEIVAVGETEGMAYFDPSDPLLGHLSEYRLNDRYQPCRVTSIDRLVADHSLPPPFLLKLDTHGVEIPILSGAKETLKQTNLLVIEAYNFTFGKPAVPFWDLCQYMLELGFRPLDAFDLLYREVDHAFWQVDFLFARSDFPLFQERRFFNAERKSIL
ncbi:MAG: FkbM family methyltransferase [Chthoniobacterales bacterium]